jgi:hypothetical protein
MTMKRLLFAFGLSLAGLAPASADAGGAVREVTVARTRIRLGDVLPTAAPEVAALDLGPAPAPSGSRIVTGQELARACAAASLRPPPGLPVAVRIVRKMQRLKPGEIEALTRHALDGSMSRGATISAVRPPRGVEVAAGWDLARAELPRPPHRTGLLQTAATLTLAVGTEVIAILSVPVDVSLSAEAAVWDLPRGGPVTLVVRRGLVEIEAAGVAAADADVGTVFQLTLRPSGHVVRARLVAKDRAELVEGGAP